MEKGRDWPLLHACQWAFLHDFLRKKVLMASITLTKTSYGNTGGSASIFWTTEYQKNAVCCVYYTVYKYIFPLICHCAQDKSPVYILEYILFDNYLCPTRHILEDCHCTCIEKQYSQIMMQKHITTVLRGIPLLSLHTHKLHRNSFIHHHQKVSDTQYFYSKAYDKPRLFWMHITGGSSKCTVGKMPHVAYQRGPQLMHF